MTDDLAQRLCNPVYNFCDDTPLIKLVASIIEKYYTDVTEVYTKVYDEKGVFNLRVTVGDNDVILVYRNSLQLDYIRTTTWLNHRHRTEGIIPISFSFTRFLTEVGSLFGLREAILAEDAYNHAKYGKDIV